MVTPDHLITSWLSLSHQVPKEALRDWQETGVAILAMGSRLAAVRLSGELVRAATGMQEPRAIAAVLEARLGGAVIHDSRPDLFYPLIDAHAALTWDDSRRAPCLGDGVYVGVPALRRTQPPGPYWAVLPRYEGDLCHPGALRELVARGEHALEDLVEIR
ncbi:hypothetical protein [Streptomyces sp. NBC_00198]|uniref:hypothetical protein n=1 Tax=Streptomyces sp. NBC_00198 TaxID=2975677 RepID=UPI00224DFF87|nr:hypothetical protein [Streptomyces sp. NBC_00198]MCX5285705.1 hypothetical protein [Streptomyces sp. NBC_00198]MCX5286193.1 hypothetical protein [Streptomyces sp. NBC_00198]